MSQSTPQRCLMLTTNWSLVRKAGGDVTHPECRAALEELCQAYWYPLYVFLRRRGHGYEESEDLVQSFFETLLEKEYLHDVERQRGSFRGFLLTALKHHVANDLKGQRRQKRGGDRLQFSLDTSSARQRWASEPAETETAEAAFDRSWALELLRRVLDGLTEEYGAQGREAWFAQFRPFLVPATDPPPYEKVGAALGMTTTAVKVNVFRLRQRYRQRLEAEIAATVNSADEIGQERQELLDALTRRR